MSGPGIINDRAHAGKADEIERAVSGNGIGWDFFQKQFLPATVNQPFDPGDDFKKDLAIWADSPSGRRQYEWLLSLTVRAPYPITTQTMEDLAFAAAKHQARSAVGEVLARAVADGRKLLNPQKETPS